MKAACPVVRNQKQESQPIPEPARVSVSLREVCSLQRPQLGQLSALWTERWHWCQRPAQKEEGDREQTQLSWCAHTRSPTLSIMESGQLMQRRCSHPTRLIRTPEGRHFSSSRWSLH